MKYILDEHEKQIFDKELKYDGQQELLNSYYLLKDSWINGVTEFVATLSVNQTRT